MALELEKYGAGKRGEAVKDAAGRLMQSPPLADLALAMVYPQSCQRESDVTADTKIEYLHVTREDIGKYTRGRHDYRRHAKQAKWSEMSIKEMPAFVSNLHKSAGRPEERAADLNHRLDIAVRRLGADDRKLLARSLRFNYDADGKKDVEQAVKNGAKRALLVVAGAALFHTQLNHLHRRPERHKGAWPPGTLDQCRNSGRIRQDLIKAWKLVRLVDYKPVFESAATVLEACSGPAFRDGISSMAEWASETADHIGGLRHDILGRIFHKVLDTAKQDGSYYTSTAAAAFLATLAIPQGQKLKGYRVIDPACGTGTLLMASAERLAETASGFDPTRLIDEVIHGVDVNTTACHMAATTLGLLSPKTDFDRMNIHAMEFGRSDRGYRAGSLEMYLDDGLLPYVEWKGSAGTQIDTGERLKSMHGRFSLVIMNPPFTRNDQRHDQFTADDEKGVKERERHLFGDAPRGMRHSSDPMFVLLAERLLKPGGTLAVVRPMSAVSSAGSLEMRKFLVANFDIETIVVSFDPERIWFSENTRINELLMVARKKRAGSGPVPGPAKIIKLAVNPATQAEAIRCAEAVNRKDTSIPNGHVQLWDQKHVGRGDWSAVLFYSNMLAELFNQLRAGDLFRAAAMRQVAYNYVSTRLVRGLFKESTSPPPAVTPYGPPSGRTRPPRPPACTLLQART